MAYNNIYPMSYQPYYPQYGQQAAQPQQNPVNQMNNSIIWVQGEAGAKSYLVAPNNTVQLWDSESQTIYLKSADASGMPSMRILDYTIRSDAGQNQQRLVNSDHNYVTMDDLKSVQDQIDEIRKELNLSKRGVTNES